MTALEAMYEYYDRGREMLENVLRDAARVPAVEKILQQKWEPLLDGIVDILTEGWSPSKAETSSIDAGRGREVQPTPQGREVERRASLRVALDFFTWRTLTASGLSNEKAARLAVAWIASATD